MSGFSRSKVYRLLKDMADAGYVRAKLEQPTYYTAVPPDDLFARIRDRWRRRVDRTDDVRDRLLEPMEALHEEPGSANGGPDWRLMQGRLSILEEIRERVEKASGIVVAAHIHPSDRPRPALRDIWTTIADRCRQGELRFRAVLSGCPAEIGPLADLDGGDRFRIRAVDRRLPGHCSVYDEELALATMATETHGRVRAEEDVAILTDAADLVDRVRVLFDGFWERGRPVDDGESSPERSDASEGPSKAGQH